MSAILAQQQRISRILHEGIDLGRQASEATGIKFDPKSTRISDVRDIVGNLHAHEQTIETLYHDSRSVSFKGQMNNQKNSLQAEICNEMESYLPEEVSLPNRKLFKDYTQVFIKRLIYGGHLREKPDSIFLGQLTQRIVTEIQLLKTLNLSDFHLGQILGKLTAEKLSYLLETYPKDILNGVFKYGDMEDKAEKFMQIYLDEHEGIYPQKFLLPRVTAKVATRIAALEPDLKVHNKFISNYVLKLIERKEVTALSDPNQVDDYAQRIIADYKGFKPFNFTEKILNTVAGKLSFKELKALLKCHARGVITQALRSKDPLAKLAENQANYDADCKYIAALPDPEDKRLAKLIASRSYVYKRSADDPCEPAKRLLEQFKADHAWIENELVGEVNQVARTIASQAFVSKRAPGQVSQLAKDLLARYRSDKEYFEMNLDADENIAATLALSSFTSPRSAAKPNGKAPDLLANYRSDIAWLESKINDSYLIHILALHNCRTMHDEKNPQGKVQLYLKNFNKDYKWLSEQDIPASAAIAIATRSCFSVHGKGHLHGHAPKLLANFKEVRKYLRAQLPNGAKIYSKRLALLIMTKDSSRIKQEAENLLGRFKENVEWFKKKLIVDEHKASLELAYILEKRSLRKPEWRETLWHRYKLVYDKLLDEYGPYIAGTVAFKCSDQKDPLSAADNVRNNYAFAYIIDYTLAHKQIETSKPKVNTLLAAINAAKLSDAEMKLVRQFLLNENSVEDHRLKEIFAKINAQMTN